MRHLKAARPQARKIGNATPAATVQAVEADPKGNPGASVVGNPSGVA